MCSGMMPVGPSPVVKVRVDDWRRDAVTKAVNSVFVTGRVE